MTGKGLDRSTQEQLRAAAAVLQSLADRGSTTNVRDLLATVRDALEARMQPTQTPPAGEVQKPQMSPAGEEQKPPEDPGEFREYLQGLTLLGFFEPTSEDTYKTIVIHRENPSDTSPMWQAIIEWVTNAEKGDDILCRTTEYVVSLDIRHLEFNKEQLKHALSTTSLPICIRVDRLHKDSPFSRTRESKKKVDPLEESLLGNSPRFFQWIREELRENHTEIILTCDEDYDATAGGFFPTLRPLAQELKSTHRLHTRLQRKHLPLVVQEILKRSKVAPGSQARLSQHIRDFDVDRMFQEETKKTGQERQMTPAQRKRISNRLKSADTFLSEALIQSVLTTFVEDGFPFDSPNDVTIEFLEAEYATQLASLGSGSASTMLGKIRKRLNGADFQFPCAEAVIFSCITQVLGEEITLATEGIPLIDLEALKPYCSLLDSVSDADAPRIFEQIRQKLGVAGGILTRKKLHEIVQQVLKKDPEYRTILEGGKGGGRSDGSGRVRRDSRTS